jgi:AcrR family transcriptional regulator
MSSRPARNRRRRRLPPDDRRRQLLDLAARVLAQHGIERLQVSDLAERAGVSRPLVYRMFRTRQLLVRALLEDFAREVTERFQAALMRTLPGSIETITRAFVEASCDAITAKGAGPWLLFDARAADTETARIGREIFARLLAPWQEQLASFIGVPPRRARNHLWVIVAAGRAALEGWIDGALSRAEAVADATLAVNALLVAFTAPPRRRRAPHASSSP